MPSIDDLEALGAATRREALTVSPPSDDVLAAVKAEGGRRRSRRHRRNSVIAGLAVALVALPAIVLLPGGEPDTDEVTTAADDSTTTESTERESTTTAPTTESTGETTAPAVVSPTDDTTTQTTARPTTTTTAPPLVCRNSTDPRCGEFRWDPAPAPNQPLVASFAAAPSTAVVGQPVEFIVDWYDNDAAFSGEYFSTDGAALGGPACVAIQPRYGPWTPPAQQPSQGSRTYPHTFTAAGTYTVTVSMWTGDCESPYASSRDITTTITVTEPPAA